MLIVTRLDRRVRSTRDLLNVIAALADRVCHARGRSPEGQEAEGRLCRMIFRSRMQRLPLRYAINFKRRASFAQIGRNLILQLLRLIDHIRGKGFLILIGCRPDNFISYGDHAISKKGAAFDVTYSKLPRPVGGV
jgi:hypothetical protein